jgi:hypothetical protein
VSLDADAVAVLDGEREAQTVAILCAHAGLTDLALDRIHAALAAIRRALNLKRPAVGLPARRAV